MRIRLIEKKDNEQVKKLIQKILVSFQLDKPGTAYYDKQLGSLAEHYQHTKGSNYWVVEQGEGLIIGCGGYGPFDRQKKIAELQKLYVAKEFQGQGISRLLMDTILKEATKDYTSIYLETSKQLKVANLLYVKYGFQELSAPLEGETHAAMDRWYMKSLESSSHYVEDY